MFNQYFTIAFIKIIALAFVIFIPSSWGQNESTTAYGNTHIFPNNDTMTSNTVFITPTVPANSTNDTSYQSMENSTIYSSLHFKSEKSYDTYSSPKTLSDGETAGAVIGGLALVFVICICCAICQPKKKPIVHVDTYTVDVVRTT